LTLLVVAFPPHAVSASGSKAIPKAWMKQCLRGPRLRLRRELPMHLLLPDQGQCWANVLAAKW
jgi:hypothetical protein